MKPAEETPNSLTDEIQMCIRDKAYWVRCALCAGAVALSAVLEYWAVPALLC